MSIFADLFVDMMPDTLTVEAFLGRDTYGAATYGPARTYTARVNNVQRNVLNAQGQMVVAKGRAWLDTVDTITVNDRVTLDDGTQPVLLNMNQVPDETGPAYTSFDFQ